MEISFTICFMLLLTAKVFGLASVSDRTLETYYFVTSDSFTDGGNGNSGEITKNTL